MTETVHLVLYYAVALYLWWGVFYTVDNTRTVYKKLKDEWNVWSNVYAVSLIILWPWAEYSFRKALKAERAEMFNKAVEEKKDGGKAD